MSINNPVTGSIARAARVIDVLAHANNGAGLTEIMTQSEFSKTTTFRVLAALQNVKYVFQDPENREYRLGHKFTELARTAARAHIASIAMQSMKRLADRSEDTVFLSIPEGASSICVSRSVGAFPIRTLTLDKGDERPLGVGAGSLALYCSMTDARRSAACRVNRNWLAEYGTSHEELEVKFTDFQSKGYALNRGGVVSGMSALAVPIVTAEGRLVAAMAIGAIDERMDNDRIDKLLLPMLREEATQIALRLGDINKE